SCSAADGSPCSMADRMRVTSLMTGWRGETVERTFSACYHTSLLPVTPVVLPAKPPLRPRHVAGPSWLPCCSRQISAAAEAGHQRWLWVAATATVAAFLIHGRRNLTVLAAEGLHGIPCSDRWGAYNAWPAYRIRWSEALAFAWLAFAH